MTYGSELTPRSISLKKNELERKVFNKINGVANLSLVLALAILSSLDDIQILNKI